MPQCWKNLTEDQRREVSTLIKSFYNDAKVNPSKSAWLSKNFKKLIYLGYVDVKDVHNFVVHIWHLVVMSLYSKNLSLRRKLSEQVMWLLWKIPT